MAYLNNEGSIIAHCVGCAGGKSTFEWRARGKEFGLLTTESQVSALEYRFITSRLFRCAGCSAVAFGVVAWLGDEESKYPGSKHKLISFYPEIVEPLALPTLVPEGITSEFREAERCLGNNCLRAAAGLFRSVLDKTMRANGFNTKKERNLQKQIDAAADAGLITQARKKKAHDEIRVLGNDVLHDDWHPIPQEDVESARHYCQRILEDFYDDRDSVLTLLRAAGRTPSEDNLQEGEGDDDV